MHICIFTYIYIYRGAWSSAPCHILQHTAIHYTTLQHTHHTATYCNTNTGTDICLLHKIERDCQSSTTHRNTPQHTATHYTTPKNPASHCNTYTSGVVRLNHQMKRDRQRSATHCNTLQHTATHCNTLTVSLHLSSIC